MPLVLVKCSRGWQLPDEQTDRLSPRMELVKAIGEKLPEIVAGAINALNAELAEIDGPDSDREVIAPEEVFVDFGNMSPYAVNGSSLQVSVAFGSGAECLSATAQSARMTRVYHEVQLGVAAVITDYVVVRKFPVTPPIVDFEFSTGLMTGCTLGRDGKLAARWGWVPEDFGVPADVV